MAYLKHSIVSIVHGHGFAYDELEVSSVAGKFRGQRAEFAFQCAGLRCSWLCTIALYLCNIIVSIHRSFTLTSNYILAACCRSSHNLCKQILYAALKLNMIPSFSMALTTEFTIIWRHPILGAWFGSGWSMAQGGRRSWIRWRAAYLKSSLCCQVLADTAEIRICSSTMFRFALSCSNCVLPWLAV